MREHLFPDSREQLSADLGFAVCQPLINNVKLIDQGLWVQLEDLKKNGREELANSFVVENVH